jgi:hypothetical protein
LHQRVDFCYSSFGLFSNIPKLFLLAVLSIFPGPLVFLFTVHGRTNLVSFVAFGCGVARALEGEGGSVRAG